MNNILNLFEYCQVSKFTWYGFERHQLWLKKNLLVNNFLWSKKQCFRSDCSNSNYSWRFYLTFVILLSKSLMMNRILLFVIYFYDFKRIIVAFALQFQLTHLLFILALPRNLVIFICKFNLLWHFQYIPFLWLQLDFNVYLVHAGMPYNSCASTLYLNFHWTFFGGILLLVNL